jgi:hypothetical protein
VRKSDGWGRSAGIDGQGYRRRSRGGNREVIGCKGEDFEPYLILEVEKK